LAAEGFDLLADELTATLQRTRDFLEVGVAYLRFAVEHRAHFEVIHHHDRAVLAAQERASEALASGIGSLPEQQARPDARLAAIAAWSLVHGLATLWLNRALPPELGDNPETVARAVAAILFAAP
jgi:hypothetical protein